MDKNKKIFTIIFLFLLTFCLINPKYHFGDNNHIEQIPHIFSKIDKNYLEKDSFVQYTKTINPRIYYSIFISSITKILGIEKTFYLLTIISNFLIALISFKTIEIFYKDTFQPLILTTFLLNFRTINIGGASMINDYYLTPQLLTMPLMLFCFYYSIKGNYKKILFCSSIAIFIQPTLTLITLIPIYINILLNTKVKQKIKKTIFLFLIILTITYFAFLRYQPNIYGSFYTYILAWFRHPHHYIPSSFDFKEYLELLIFLFLELMSLIYLLKIDKPNKSKYKKIFYTTITSIILLISAYFFVEIIQIKQIVELQLFRIVFLIKFTGVITIATAVIKIISQKFNIKITNLIITSITLTILFLNYQSISLKKIINPNIYSVPTLTRVKLFEFIKQNTDQSSLFLTPPNFGELRINGQRAIVVDWKAFPFNQKDAINWFSKIENCYGTSNLEYNYTQLTDLKMVELKNKYNFNYVILYSGTKTLFNKIYQDEYFDIIEI